MSYFIALKLQEKNANLFYTQRRGSGNFRNLVFPNIIITIFLLWLIIITIAYFLWWHLLCLSSCGRHCLLLHAGQNLQPAALEPFRPSTDSTPSPPSFSDQGLLGTTWALYGHYLGTDCVLRWTTWGLLLDYFKAFLGYLGTTWWMLITLVPLGIHWVTVGGGCLAMLITCSSLVPPLVLGLQIKNLVLGVVCHLQSASSSIHGDN